MNRRHLGVHPEGFNLVNLEVQQGQTGYPLRPEHAESLFYAHRATGGSELLRAGADVNTQHADRREANASTWALVDEIRAAGGWQNYVTRRRAALVRAISDAFRGKFPEVIYAEIAPYMEAPGGDDD